DDKLPSWIRDSRTAMKETGKALVAWDEWGKNPARAAGAVTFNVLTTVFTGGAGGAAAGAGKAGAVAKALSVAGKAGRAIDPMTYIAKGAGAGLSRVGDLAKSLRGVGNIDIPTLPDGSVRLPDGRLLDPHGNLMTPNGAIDTTPIPRETTSTLPAHWTVQGQQPVYAGVHAGDNLVDGVRTTDTTAYNRMSTDTPVRDAPTEVSYTPHTGGHEFPNGSGHDPNPVSRSSTHEMPGGHTDDISHGTGHDGGHTKYGDGPTDQLAQGYTDDIADAVDQVDQVDLGDTAVDTAVDDAVHHGTDTPVEPGRGDTDVPQHGGGNEPFEYKPLMSDLEFDALSDAEKHAVAEAELARGTNPAPSVSNKAGLDYGNAYWGEFMEDLPLEKKQGLITYTGIAYDSINSHLRYGTDVPQHILDTIESMDEVMDARPVPEDIMVVRGTGVDHIKVGGRPIDSPLDMLGGTFDDKAFTSTALGKTPPPPFDQKPVWMHLRVPKGTPALWLEPITQVKGERELLLAKGSHYRVTRVFYDDTHGKWHIYGEVLPRQKP
ncbi:ADP-ribosyltransferase, partial [Streptomyces sp. LB8]